MLARMYWKKVVSRGEQYYQITRLENFKYEKELPEKYISQAPFMIAVPCEYGRRQTIAIFIRYPTTKHNDIGNDIIKLDALLTEQEKNSAIHWMKICGQRLSSINKTLTVKNADWTGEGFDEI